MLALSVRSAFGFLRGHAIAPGAGDDLAVQLVGASPMNKLAGRIGADAVKVVVQVGGGPDMAGVVLIRQGAV